MTAFRLQLIVEIKTFFQRSFTMIGNNIKRLRTEQNMTQKNLADKLFVSAQAVSILFFAYPRHRNLQNLQNL